MTKLERRGSKDEESAIDYCFHTITKLLIEVFHFVSLGTCETWPTTIPWTVPVPGEAEALLLL